MSRALPCIAVDATIRIMPLRSWTVVDGGGGWRRVVDGGDRGKIRHPNSLTRIRAVGLLGARCSVLEDG
jgi:hypothetical protein